MVTQRTGPLPVVRVGDLPCQDTPRRWLVEHLWGAAAVGVIGGAPKCSKTWLGLDLALSVATGTPALGRYTVSRHPDIGRHGVGLPSPHVDRSLRDRTRVSERLAHVTRFATRHKL